MHNFEIKPKFFNSATSLMMLFCFAGSFPLFFVLSKAYKNHLEYPNEPLYFQIFLMISFSIVIIWLIFVIFALVTLNREIIVENDLIYFKQKTNLGFGKWIIKNVINPKVVDIILDRQKTSFISTGKGIIPIVLYWINFQYKNGTKQEILLNGWSISDIKSLFYYIKGKYPHIKFNNNIMMDTPEKIAGFNS